MSASSSVQSLVVAGIAGVAAGGAMQNGRTIIEIRGAGKELPYELRPGMVNASGSVDLIPAAASIAGLINKALFTAGVLGNIATIIGTSEVATYTHTEAYIESLTMTCNVDEAVRASMSWKAKSWAKGAGSADYIGGAFVSQIFDEVEDIGQSFTIAISNTLAVKGKLGGTDGAVDYIVGTGQSIVVTRVSSGFIDDGGAAGSWTILGKTWAGKIESGEVPTVQDGDILHTAVLKVDTVT